MSAVSKLAGMLAGAREATNQFGESVEQLRARVAILQDERYRLTNMAVPKQVALQRLAIWLDQMAQPITGFNVSSFAERDDFRAPDVHGPRFIAAAIALAAKPALTERLEAYYSKQTVVSEAERDQARAKLDAELLDLELAEESLIREAEAAGLTILRRADADPRAVLAAQSSLP